MADMHTASELSSGLSSKRSPELSGDAASGPSSRSSSRPNLGLSLCSKTQLFVLVLALLAAAQTAQGQLTKAQIVELVQPDCSNGTVSFTQKCNTTTYFYSAGCPSDEEEELCTAPVRGLTCREVPEYNVTCLIPIFCYGLEVPENANADIAIPTFGETVTVTCNLGYERTDQIGFSATSMCTEYANLTEYNPPGISCRPVRCGRYCRYCLEPYTTRPVAASNPDRSSYPYEDKYGACCLVRPDPLFDDIPSNDPFVKNGIMAEPWGASLGEKLTITCNNGFGAVPSAGFTEPECIPRTDCLYDITQVSDTNNDGSISSTEYQAGWNDNCKNVRGKFQTGAVCEQFVEPVTISYSAAVTVNCPDSAVDCEFPEQVDVSLATVATGDVTIYWSFSGSPVTPPTGNAMSTASSTGRSYSGTPITISSSRQGCNVITAFEQITAVAVKDGFPNSPVLVSPEIKVTATNGRMPDNMTACTNMPQEKFVCSNPQITTETACTSQSFTYAAAKPPDLFDGCVAYRYYAFIPIALSGTEADAMALSEMQFYFRGRQVTGVEAVTDGKFPAAEAPRFLVDQSLDSKLLTLTSCHVELDFGRAVVLDSFKVGTANDCTSRDPARWKILASRDTGPDKEWILVYDQSTISFAMPLQRTFLTDSVPMPRLTPYNFTGKFKNNAFLLQESTSLPNANNTITLTVRVTLQDDTDKLLPLGSVLSLGGIRDDRTDNTGTFPIMSRIVTTQGSSARGVLALGQLYTSGSTRKLDATIGQCYPEMMVVITFHFMNPSSARPPSSFSLESTGVMRIPPLTQSGTDILTGSGRLELFQFRALEANKVAKKLNTIRLTFFFNARPMKGTFLRVKSLLNSKSNSDPQLPVTFEMEDGTQVAGEANFDKLTGDLTTTLPADSPVVCHADGRCGCWGVNLNCGEPSCDSNGVCAKPVPRITLVFDLYNPDAVQEPWTLEVEGLFCAHPSSVGCTDDDKVPFGPELSEGDVLGGSVECQEPEDLCGVCGGNNTLCAGCDGVANSGKVVDQCGYCGSVDDIEFDSCVGCDGVVYANASDAKKIDACGVCGGNNTCKDGVVTDLEAVDFPFIAVNLTIVNGPGIQLFQDQDEFKIRTAVADTVQVPVGSIDLLGVRDAPAGKGDFPSPSARRQVLLPAGTIMRYPAQKLPDWAVCTVEKHSWSGCEVNVGPDVVEEYIPSRYLHDSSLLQDQNDDAATSFLRSARSLLQTGPVPPPTGVIDVDLRINFIADTSVLEKAQILEDVVFNGTLADKMNDQRLCDWSGSAGPCRILLFEPIVVSLLNPPPPPSTEPPEEESDFVLIVTILSSLGGALVICCLAVLWKWRGALWERRKQLSYKLEDLMVASERGREEQIRRAPPSTFNPPEGYETMTRASSRMSKKSLSIKSGTMSDAGSSKFSSIAGSFKQKFPQLARSKSSRSAASSEKGEVVGYLTTEDWPPKMEPESKLKKSKSTTKKILAPRDRAALFAEAFPESGVTPHQASIFERDSDDEELPMVEENSREDAFSASPSIAASAKSTLSDQYGHRLDPGPTGRGPAPVAGSSAVRDLDHHPSQDGSTGVRTPRSQGVGDNMSVRSGSVRSGSVRSGKLFPPLKSNGHSNGANGANGNGAPRSNGIVNGHIMK